MKLASLTFAAAKLAMSDQFVLGPRFDQFMTRAGGAKLKPGTGWIKGEDGVVLPIQGVAIGVQTWMTWGQN